MGTRGRKSAASLEVVQGNVEVVKRPEPPRGLGRQGSDCFRRVVADKPADWFSDSNLDMLVQYCRHVVAADRASQIIANIESQDELDLDELDKAYKMQERQSQRIESLATKMRISPQSTTNHRGNQRANPIENPWD